MFLKKGTILAAAVALAVLGGCANQNEFESLTTRVSKVEQGISGLDSKVGVLAGDRQAVERAAKAAEDAKAAADRAAVAAEEARKAAAAAEAAFRKSLRK